MTSSASARMRWSRRDAARAFRSAMNGPDHALALRVFRDGEPVFVGDQLGQNEG